MCTQHAFHRDCLFCQCIGHTMHFDTHQASQPNRACRECWLIRHTDATWHYGMRRYLTCHRVTVNVDLTAMKFQPIWVLGNMNTKNWLFWFDYDIMFRKLMQIPKWMRSIDIQLSRNGVYQWVFAWGQSHQHQHQVIKLALNIAFQRVHHIKFVLHLNFGNVVMTFQFSNQDLKHEWECTLKWVNAFQISNEPNENF